MKSENGKQVMVMYFGTLPELYFGPCSKVHVLWIVYGLNVNSFNLQMPRSKANVKRAKPIAENVEKAANSVLQKQLSLRQASADFNVSKATLCRHLKKHRDLGHEHFVYSAAQDVKLVFTKEQEEELLKYVTICAKMHYGLSTIELRKLAYNYARVNHIDCPSSWETNQKAGKEWYR